MGNSNGTVVQPGDSRKSRRLRVRKATLRGHDLGSVDPMRHRPGNWRAPKSGSRCRWDRREPRPHRSRLAHRPATSRPGKAQRSQERSTSGSRSTSNAHSRFAYCFMTRFLGRSCRKRPREIVTRVTRGITIPQTDIFRSTRIRSWRIDAASIRRFPAWNQASADTSNGNDGTELNGFESGGGAA